MEDVIAHPTLFRRGHRGATRTWYVEARGASYRTVSGILKGKQIVSGWKQCRGKFGRSDAEQALFEVERAYRHHLARDYRESVEAALEEWLFKPMLASKYTTFEPGFAQPKLDGIRCIARRDGLFTREGRPIHGTPHIWQALVRIFAAHPDAVLDGELYGHELRDRFDEVASLVMRRQPDAAHRTRSAALIQYHVYDLPSDGGSFGTRLHTLRRLAARLLGIAIVETHSVADEGSYDDLHRRWLQEGYEGSMWRADASYEQTRSKALRKRKEHDDAEFECFAINEGTGSCAGTAVSVTCRMLDGRTFSAGVRGKRAFARALLGRCPRMTTVQYFGYTQSGIPRFPTAVKFFD